MVFQNKLRRNAFQKKYKIKQNYIAQLFSTICKMKCFAAYESAYCHHGMAV
jgi:hypothetical protein